MDSDRAGRFGLFRRAALLIGVLLAIAGCTVDDSNRDDPWMTDREKGYAIPP